MEDIGNFKLVERTFTLENTITENTALKKNNKFLIATSLFIGAVAIGLCIYLIDQELQKK